MEQRRDRLQELVDQCEDEELMDIVLPRLTKVMSLWELMLAKVEQGGSVRSGFPDIYHEFESLQAHVRQAAQEYIISPQGGATPLEVRNIEVARCLGILDEVNKMKVVPGASASSTVTNKNVRYMENSKMLPPSKRFKMENSVPVHQNGIETPKKVEMPPTPLASALKSCSVSISPVVIPSATTLMPTPPATSSSTAPADSSSTQAPPTDTPMEVTPSAAADHAEDLQPDNAQEEPQQTEQDQDLSASDITDQMQELEKALGSNPEQSTETTTPESDSKQTSSQHEQSESVSQADNGAIAACEVTELQEGQEIYIQAEGLTMQLAESSSDRIVIVNGPDGTTMHIQTPEGVPLEAVQALLGIEASEEAKAPQ